MRFITSTDRKLARLALPVIFANVTIPLLGIVDTAVVGHLDSPNYLGGVAIGATAVSFVYMLLMFLRMTTTGLTAQAFGAADGRGLLRDLLQPLLIAALCGVVIVALSVPLTRMALWLTGGDPAVLIQAQHYLSVRWLSAPAALCNLVLIGWLLGVQNVRAPVLLTIAGNLLNIVLALWFVMGLHWQVRGVAAATVLAEYFTLALSVWLALAQMRRMQLPLADWRAALRGNVRRLLTLNRDIMLRSLLLQCCFASLTVVGARLGPGVVAANALLLNFLTFTAYALDGFAYAVEASAGQAHGARDRGMLLATLRSAVKQAGLIALIFSMIYLLAGGQIIRQLTSIAALRDQAGHYLPWLAVLPLLAVWCYLLDGLFVGATRGRDMRNSMLVAAVGYGLTLSLLPWLGNHALWLALSVFMVLRALTLWRVWRRAWRENRWFTS